MNPREKRLALIFGVAVGCYAIYFLIDVIYLSPIASYETDIKNYGDQKRELMELVDSELDLAQTWRSFANRTFSDDDAVAFDKFSRRLKETATLHGFDSALITKISKPTTISEENKLRTTTIKYDITVKDEYARVIELLRGLYDAPYISQITDLVLTPDSDAGRNVVKLDCRVATVVLPKVPPKETSNWEKFLTMQKLDDKAPSDPWRKDVLPASAYTVALNNQNIFKAFEPAPRQQVIVENLDLKTVGVELAFMWEGKETVVRQSAIQPTKQQTFFGEGDLVELKGAYADGNVFTMKHSFASGKPWSYKVARHTPEEKPPPPITLVVNNQDEDEARFTVTIVDNENQTRVLPEMVVAASSQADLGAFKDTKQVKIAGKYASGKDVRMQTFMPRPTPQTYTIAKDIVVEDNQPVEVEQPVKVVIEDEDGSPDHVVKALLAYETPEGDYVQEMIVEGPDGREVIRAGTWGTVDGDGALRSVCALGGIVQMKASGNYYIYPRGKSFAERERLQAENDEQLASAIMEWSKGSYAIGG